ncbi:efflux RND transporter permease subunit [Mesosutterella sp. AGMB02718]|uniref:Efflux pump membrane transporter n=1 Tax=Mesosutterella faecium TaxID=2925194 RepID=A0ABT7IKH9_9BURK|nr:efflux RND transporter permease subunit [Mesosutterella sp. AGMB02718]MDL2058869.1 efflux RND transporter permease subunit [Mesosutterella sp. AGMB02718]
MSRFFIDRPIFAWVIALVLMLMGTLSIFTMPVSQYPQIAPPQVTVVANYPGASAETLQNTVTQVIEQQMVGLDGLIYMSNESDGTGRMQMTLTFAPGTNADIAQVQVNNKLSMAEAMLPQDVTRLGIQVQKSTASFLMVVSFTTDDGSLSVADLGDFLVNTVQDPLSRITGVGQTTVFGASYAMRVWLDPHKLYAYNLTASDVTSAIAAQNAQVTAGQLGGLPHPSDQPVELNATITAQSLLKSVDDFKKLIVKTTESGATVRLADVANIELGRQSYDVQGTYNGIPASGIAIYLSAGANAIETADLVKKKVAELQPYFPAGMKVVYPYETTPFVKAAMKEVVKTLIEAIILVVIVMYLFLQNWRATLIPAVAVPVVLLGTFAVLKLTGFTLNMLTMFGLVLAIGLLVDDAIVVVENVERVMREDGTDARTATIKSMSQITGALVGVALVLSAVFIPMAFFGGSTGVIYRQFSITIVTAMLLSVTVALSLSPALCASILKPVSDSHHFGKKGFFGAFNRGFEKVSNDCRRLVLWTHNHLWMTLGVYALIWIGVVVGFMKLPGSFVPEEDQGTMMFTVQTPAGSAQERVQEAEKQIRDYFFSKEKKYTDSVFDVAGFSLAGGGQNMGLGFVKLKDWAERTGKGSDPQSIALRANIAMSKYKDARIVFFPPPAIPELGIADGFDMYIEDRSGQGHEKLMQVRNQFLAMANKDPRLSLVRPNGMEDTPQYKLEMDREKLQSYGITLSNANTDLSTIWGGTYVNLFIDRERVKRVYVQADPHFRMTPDDLKQWYVRNSSGELVPFSGFSTGSWTFGSPRLERFNANAAVNIQGNAAPGVSSGTAMDAVEEIAKKLPAGYAIEWNGVSYQERMASQAAAPLYALSLLVVFLCLAALYESWTIPISILLVVPTGVLGALAMTGLLGGHNDVYFQVGMLTTIGLVSKNAILIVEFAKMLYDAGEDLITASLDAVKLRFRPIVMTSLAFGLGVVPLVLAHGAGAGAQNAIGMAVLGGIITGTILCVCLVPMFYVQVNRIFRTKRRQLPDDKGAAV